jgi:hypothetical protein
VTSVSPDARRVWVASRGPVAIGLVVVFAAIGIALVHGGGEGGSLDPRSVDPSGSRALARLLEAEGVRIELVETADRAMAAAPGATLLVTLPERVRPERLAEVVRPAAAAVLVAPPAEVSRALGLPVTVAGPDDVSDRRPGCGFDEAGVARLGGLRFETDRGEVCYGGALVRFGSVALLGTPLPLTNDALADQGDAALSLRLLGQHERLVWYLPSPTDPSARPDHRSLASLLPDGWVFGAIQVAVAVVLFALWRARRLGPVVAEPLPVVVRAAETAEGRARLYQRAGAADHAAEALRQAARARLISRLGLRRDAGPAEVCEAVAARTGTPAHDLLYGPAPADDAALVRLAGALDDLEREMGRR